MIRVTSGNGKGDKVAFKKENTTSWDMEIPMNQTDASVTQIRAELERIVQARWTPEVFRRFQCVWLAHVLNLSAPEIAAALGLNVSTVRRIRTEFAREGACAIEGKGNRGGRRNQCMSFEEEVVFLRNHQELFSRSGIVQASALKEAFEARAGRLVHKTTIYRLLERHGRRRAGVEASPAGSRRKGAAGHKRKTGRAR
jgi:transposase